MNHEWRGTMCIWCGITRGRYARAYADTGIGPSCERGATPCGHPLAARRIVWDESRLPEGFHTTCWACAVEREIATQPMSRPVLSASSKKKHGSKVNAALQW